MAEPLTINSYHFRPYVFGSKISSNSKVRRTIISMTHKTSKTTKYERYKISKIKVLPVLESPPFSSCSVPFFGRKRSGACMLIIPNKECSWIASSDEISSSDVIFVHSSTKTELSRVPSARVNGY